MPRQDAKTKESLALDIEELRRKLGPVKVALIEQWIREVNGPLDAAIAAAMPPDAIVLDAGCSRGDPDLPALSRARFYLGCDVDLPGLRANTLAHAVACAPISALPVRDASIDLVHAKWVVEHLEDPARDFREVARVLKPGGRFVLLTPNAASIFTVLSTAIPYRLKQYLKHLMFGVHEEDTFRTWYRANTRAALDRVAAEAGLVPGYFERLPGMWTFFIFAPPIARLVRRIEMVQACIPLLRPVLTYIIAVYRKA